MRCSATVATTSAASATPRAMRTAITNRDHGNAKRVRGSVGPPSTGSSGEASAAAARDSGGDAEPAIRPRLPNEILQNAFVHAGLRRFLLDAGASEADIERADAEGWLP